MPTVQQLEAASTPWQWVVLGVWTLGMVLSLVFVLRILAQGGAPATTLLWVVVILLAPWIGMGLYYLFPRRLQLRRLRRLRSKQERWRTEVRARAAGPVDLGVAAADGAASTAGALYGLLRATAADGLSEGNAVRWLPRGGEFFTAAAAAIERARSFVHFQVYILRPDATGMQFLAMLAAAARRGVAVRLLFDSIGSFGLKARHLADIRAAGGLAEPFLPLLWKRRPFTINLRNHRKLLVVDGQVAFVGGRNIGDEYATDRLGTRRDWQDAMVQVDGPAVSDLHHLFAEDWFNATDEELVEARWFPPPRRAGTDCVATVGSGPDRDDQPLWFAIFQAVSTAQKSIDLTSPYLVPPPTLLFALVVAAARGVRVRICTNGPQTEAVVLYHAQRSYYKDLLRAGIELYETETDYNHAKLLVVDAHIVMVGSANLDMRSAHLNFEVAVVLPDSPALAAEILTTLAQRLQRARRVDATMLSSSLLRRVVDGTCRLLSPIL